MVDGSGRKKSDVSPLVYKGIGTVKGPKVLMAGVKEPEIAVVETIEQEMLKANKGIE